MILNRKLTIHARMHCHATTATDHFQPSSRFTDAIAATQGVYKRLKIRSVAGFNVHQVPQ